MSEAHVLLNLQQLSRLLRVPATWLKAEADASRLPCVRAGSQRLFNAEVVERILAERAAKERTDGR
jgi:hypothetical protein